MKNTKIKEMVKEKFKDLKLKDEDILNFTKELQNALKSKALANN